jgi:hypothetical protein
MASAPLTRVETLTGEVLGAVAQSCTPQDAAAALGLGAASVFCDAATTARVVDTFSGVAKAVVASKKGPTLPVSPEALDNRAAVDIVKELERYGVVDIVNNALAKKWVLADVDVSVRTADVVYLIQLHRKGGVTKSKAMDLFVACCTVFRHSKHWKVANGRNETVFTRV